ncbi:hypothetical protein [Nocardia jinanensis]|uniref:hypothetical protein n=1 Tax=Nocardia jinanensis TaxID=382504 RepID=UPI000B1B19B0|nr:hypothetical protein [Nocardia jinanensis]
MQKALVGSIAALAIAAGSVTAAGTATASGLPLDTTTPHTVQDASTGSGVGHQPSGSSLGGPISSGSAEAAGSLIALLGIIFGDPRPCPVLC